MISKPPDSVASGPGPTKLPEPPAGLPTRSSRTVRPPDSDKSACRGGRADKFLGWFEEHPRRGIVLAALVVALGIFTVAMISREEGSPVVQSKAAMTSQPQKAATKPQMPKELLPAPAEKTPEPAPEATKPVEPAKPAELAKPAMNTGIP